MTSKTHLIYFSSTKTTKKIVDGDGEIFFGVLLAYDVLVEVFFYASGVRQFFAAEGRPAGLLFVLPDDVAAKPDAVGADIDLVRAFDEGILLGACPAAEAAYGPDFIGIILFCH